MPNDLSALADPYPLTSFSAGVGVSLIYIPAVIIVGFYFETKRGIANGIANSGSGLGAFIYAPLGHVLLVTYGWRGALLVLSGLVLNCLFFSMLFRPLTTRKRILQTELMDTALDAEKNNVAKNVGKQPDDVISRSLGDIPLTSLLRDTPTVVVPEIKDTSKPQLPPPKLLVPKGEPFINGSTVSMPQMRKSTSLHDQLLHQKTQKRLQEVKADSHRSHSDLFRSQELASRPMYRKDVFYSGSLARLPEYRSNPGSVNYIASMIRIPSRSVNPSCRAYHNRRVVNAKNTEDNTLEKSARLCRMTLNLHCFLF